MIKRVVIAGILGGLVAPASAHRLDEYLQAATLEVNRDRIEIRIRLTPGVAVARSVMAAIDSNTDGVISEAEQQDYAERVRRDLSLRIDGSSAPLRRVSSVFPSIADMMASLGDIVLDFQADVPGGGPSRSVTFENYHQHGISVYLVNCLVPRDPDLRIVAQDRSYDQALYHLEYRQSGPALRPPSAEDRGLLRRAALALATVALCGIAMSVALRRLWRA